jgi:hypothetical protein
LQDGIFGNMILNVLAINQLPTMIILQRPEKRYLTIRKATFGHPKGISTTCVLCCSLVEIDFISINTVYHLFRGRMSIEVTEICQGFVDLAGGSYLEITSLSPIKSIFTDPCPV